MTDFTFTIKRSRFDEHYNPAENTRITTNLPTARGETVSRTCAMRWQ